MNKSQSHPLSAKGGLVRRESEGDTPLDIRAMKTKENQTCYDSENPSSNSQERGDSTHSHSRSDGLQSTANDTLPDGVERHATYPCVDCLGSGHKKANYLNDFCKVCNGSGYLFTPSVNKNLGQVGLQTESQKGECHNMHSNGSCSNGQVETFDYLDKHIFSGELKTEEGNSLGDWIPLNVAYKAVDKERQRVLGLIDSFIEKYEKCFCPECKEEIGCYSHYCEKCKSRVAIAGEYDSFILDELRKQIEGKDENN